MRGETPASCNECSDGRVKCVGIIEDLSFFSFFFCNGVRKKGGRKVSEPNVTARELGGLNGYGRHYACGVTGFFGRSGHFVSGPWKRTGL